MGETQIYSQRLHGITEKRRIQSEVDRIRRELDQQRVTLHQLKRKSLRDRWLMDGLVPTAETENPLSETESHIKDLEVQLESLQSELMYLQNPELKALKGDKVQGVTSKKDLVNGERNLQHVDQNENLKEHLITEEVEQQGDSQEAHPAVSQKDLISSTGRGDEHAVPAPQDKTILENLVEAEHNLDLELSKSNEPGDKPTHPSQNVDVSVHKDADDGHKSPSIDDEIQDSEHSQELQHREAEWQDPGKNSPELNPDGNTIDEDQSTPKQKLENTLEQEDHNLRSPTAESVSVNQKTENSPPNSGQENCNNDSFNQNQDNKETLLDEITKLVNLGEEKEANEQSLDDNQPSLSEEHLNPESISTHNNKEKGLNLEENNVSVLISHEQGHNPDEELALSLETEKAHHVLLNVPEQTKKPGAVCMETVAPDVNQGSILLQENQTPDSAPLPVENIQNSVLPPSDKETCATLPCTDQVPSQSLPRGSQNQVDQIQISQFLVVSPPGHEQRSSLSCTDQVPNQSLPRGSQNQVDQIQISQLLVVPPPGHEQRSSNSPQGPSASHQPGTKETISAPESRPLLQKPQETDTHQGANTAETRDKSTPTKKKTCQCCVVM